MAKFSFDFIYSHSMCPIPSSSIFLLMQHYNMTESFINVLVLGNYVFTGIFTMEAILKLFSYNPSAYFADDWNTFDFVVVVGSLADIGLAGAGVSIGFLRLFRAAR